ncbi:hypothetical protein [Streptomyces sp. NPDC101234]|uniref:hypothetical protein n=1 Tax=Streptomyces sp. NPDC101234 TaxID=3366138 RepID=UPI0038092185
MNLRKNSRDTSRQRAQKALAHSRQSHAYLVSVLLVLLLTTAALGYFGIRDLTSAFTFPGRLTGAVLVAVAFISFLGTAALVDHWLFRTFPHSGPVALLGVFAALLTNLALFFDLVSNADSRRWMAFFGALTLGSAWAVFVVWRTKIVIPAPKRVATALIATTIIAVGNFGYQNLYLPSRVEVRPIIKISMDSPVTSKGHNSFAIPVTITFENHSNQSFNVLGTEFHAMAQRVPLSPTDQLRQKWRTEASQWNSFERTNPLSRREIHQPGDLVEAQPWMRYGDPIGANDIVTARIIVQLPMNTPYDQVTFYASAHIARADRVSLDQLKPATNEYSWRGGKLPGWMKRGKDYKDYDSIIYESDLQENNAIDAETRTPRHLTVYWQFSLHGADILETITARGKDESQKTTANRYGVTVIQVGPIERTLWDIKSRQ